MDKHSFTKIEKEFWPKYRDEINHARNTVEVSGIFSITVAEFLNEALNQKGIVGDYIEFLPNNPSHYKFCEELLSNKTFRETFNSSDLGNIIDRFVHTANSRYVHLSKLPEKTNSKIKRH